MRMTETLRKCTLVSNIMTGKHEGLHVHFEDFADLIKDECLDAESWQEKNAELNHKTHRYCPEFHPCSTSAPVDVAPERNRQKAEIAVVDAVEFTYWCHENIFPFLQLNEVRERVNEFLISEISKRQLYANYANIKTRQGVRRSDSDKEKTMASFMQRSTNRLHDRISREAAADDNRSK